MSECYCLVQIVGVDENEGNNIRGEKFVVPSKSIKHFNANNFSNNMQKFKFISYKFKSSVTEIDGIQTEGRRYTCCVLKIAGKYLYKHCFFYKFNIYIGIVPQTR